MPTTSPSTQSAAPLVEEHLRDCPPVIEAGGVDAFAACVVAEARRWTETLLTPEQLADSVAVSDMFVAMIEASIVRRMRPASRSLRKRIADLVTRSALEGADLQEAANQGADLIETAGRRRIHEARQAALAHADWMIENRKAQAAAEGGGA
ncbi:MAG: hypothetical protein AAF078_00265 [Planctomycetota bacterium]